VLVAGPWGRAAPYTVDPSYFSPNAFAALASRGHRAAWHQLTRSSYRVLKQSRGGNPPLPPDWAKVGTSGDAHASAAPSGASGGSPPMRYGPDAARVTVRLAESCDPRAHRIAAAAWPFLRGVTAAGRTPVLAYDLSGRPLSTATNPVTLVAAAGAAYAAGRRNAGDALLGRAQALDARQQTYYGDAWVALGRVMLQTHLLGSCAMG
jgi:endoglucanase